MEKMLLRILLGFALIIDPSAVFAGETGSTATSMFQPLPEKAQSADNPITDDKVRLGRLLYLDTRLSLANDISCNTCHDLEKFGVDNDPVSAGHKGQKGNRNSPTVYNAAIHSSQFWDGRAKDVEEQALGPILNPVEMAMPGEKEVVERLKGVPEYVSLFNKAFPSEKDPVSYKNVGKAIGAFERTLLTPSRFDKFLRGDESALTDAEKKGLDTFVAVGCTTCHFGTPVGGLLSQKLGLVKPYPTEDLGRFEVTKNEGDKYFFKVPSLRNIEKTGPYFHDGTVESLEDAVKLMGAHQLGRKLSEEQTQEIITFLKSLTGEVPKGVLEQN